VRMFGPASCWRAQPQRRSDRPAAMWLHAGLHRSAVAPAGWHGEPCLPQIREGEVGAVELGDNQPGARHEGCAEVGAGEIGAAGLDLETAGPGPVRCVFRFKVACEGSADRRREVGARRSPGQVGAAQDGAVQGRALKISARRSHRRVCR